MLGWAGYAAVFLAGMGARIRHTNMIQVEIRKTPLLCVVFRAVCAAVLGALLISILLCYEGKGDDL
jgi:hypothetical protein